MDLFKQALSESGMALPGGFKDLFIIMFGSCETLENSLPVIYSRKVTVLRY